jgi:hypothetical protein
MMRSRFAVQFRILIFVIIGSAGFWLSSVLFFAIVVAPLPQEPGWCLETRDGFGDEAGWHSAQCVEFANAFEEAKYFHNLSVIDAHERYSYGTWVTGALLGWLVLYHLPRRSASTADPAALVAATVIGLVTAALGPRLTGALLPTPAEWFPQVIVDYADRQQEYWLDATRAAASALDSERSIK